MRKLIITLSLALAASPVYAMCTTQTIIANGKTVVCTTCCTATGCTTVCV